MKILINSNSQFCSCHHNIILFKQFTPAHKLRHSLRPSPRSTSIMIVLSHLRFTQLRQDLCASQIFAIISSRKLCVKMLWPTAFNPAHILTKCIILRLHYRTLP